jgi:hypothetical protein
MHEGHSGGVRGDEVSVPESEEVNVQDWGAGDVCVTGTRGGELCGG